MSSVIELIDIRKSYFPGNTELKVLHGINLSITKGELVAIMGPSGSGKSTLMNLLGLLDKPTTGSYLLAGKDTSALNDRELARFRGLTIGFVFQSFYLLSRLTAQQNVNLPLRYRSVKTTTANERSYAMLERVGMQQYCKHYPNELSGGQQQRVAIARALVGEPSVLLADEPTGALDSKTGQEIMNLFLNLNRQEKATVVIITHDPGVAEQCDRTIHIHDGLIVSE